MKLSFKAFFLFAASVLVTCTSFAQPAKNLQLRASISYAPQSLAGCWHYETGSKSYALLGGSGGLIVVDVTLPDSPFTVLQVPGIDNRWREVRVKDHFAYVVTEGRDTNTLSEGLQIINLSYLPDSAPSKIYKGDGLIENELASAHTVTVDGDYLYINGHNIQSLGRGVLICNISDPWNPVYMGAITMNYCHDSYVRGDTIYTSDIYAGQFSVYNISDRSSPVLLATQQTPGNFNHNTWLSDDGQTLYTTDEMANQPLGSYDVSDLSNITLLDSYFTLHFPASAVHNVRVLNDYLINPSYGSQLTIVDAARPFNLVEVGNYTTGQYLLWDADPYLSSGIVTATETNLGIFFVFDPVYQRACYLEGIVTDSTTGIAIPATQVEILSTSIRKNSNGQGEYFTGTADSGVYAVQFSKQGYNTKVVQSVSLHNGMVTVLNVELSALNPGIDDMDASDSGIKISPVPFTSHIRLESTREELKSVRLYSLEGKCLKEWTDLPSGNVKTLLTEEIQQGIYFLEMLLESGVHFSKIQKLR